jgi:outer membrane receptor protein involved in Fe transport
MLNTVTKTEVDRTWTDILPSANLTYSLNEESNLRASYFRSLARPEFRELTNLGYYDYELSATITGNPSLERTTINNFDLRYEWFLGKGEVFSASLFYNNSTIHWRTR